MRGLRFADRLMDPLDLFSGVFGLGGASLRACSASTQRAWSGFASTDRIWSVSFRYRSAARACRRSCAGALLLIVQDLAEAREIDLGGARFLLRILAPHMKAGNARCLFEQEPALDRLG